MIYYFLLLYRHKNLSLRRETDYKKNLFITTLLIIFSAMPLVLLFITVSKDDIETFSVFIIPIILVLDLSLRFLKKNTKVAIFYYLTLPIPRKTLIFYIIMSDLLCFWTWGCALVYSIILSYFGILTFWTTITLLFMILLNNYLIFFVKALIDGYAILTYPICLGLVFVILFFAVFNPIIAILITAIVLLALFVSLFFTLKENLYKELNHNAL